MRVLWFVANHLLVFVALPAVGAALLGVAELIAGLAFVHFDYLPEA